MNAFTSFMKGLFDDPDWTEDEPEALANNVVAERFCRKASWPSRFPCRSPIYFSFQKLRR